MGIFDFFKKKRKPPKILGMIQVFGEIKAASGFNRQVVVIDISESNVVCLCMPSATGYVLGSNIFVGSKIELNFVLPFTTESIDVKGIVSKDPEKDDIFPEIEVLYIDITSIKPKDREEIAVFVDEQQYIMTRARVDKRRIFMDSIKCKVDVSFSSEAGFPISGGKIKRISSWGVLCEIPYKPNLVIPAETKVDLIFQFLSGLVVRSCVLDWIASDHNDDKATFIAFHFRKLKYNERMSIIKFASVKRWHKLKTFKSEV